MHFFPFLPPKSKHSHVDDILLVASNAPKDVMKDIRKEFEIKNGEYRPPTRYLGAGISKVQLSTVKNAGAWRVRNK
jgi:hypothetical protein